MRWLGSLADKIKALGSSGPDPRSYLAKRGIPFVSIFDEDPAFAEPKRRVDALVADGRLEHFPALFRHHFQTGTLLANGWPVYALQRRYFSSNTTSPRSKPPFRRSRRPMHACPMRIRRRSSAMRMNGWPTPIAATAP
jgi:hypothetical protein